MRRRDEQKPAEDCPARGADGGERLGTQRNPAEERLTRRAGCGEQRTARQDPAGDGGACPASSGERRKARHAARREARNREREALKRLPRRERLRAWWRTRSLGLVFAVYLAVYLAAATFVALTGIEMLSGFVDGYFYRVELEVGDGVTRSGVIDSGPYIYNPETDELLRAAELDLPDGEPYAVFIATNAYDTADARSEEPGDSLAATTDMVRDGKVRLYDWGLNYNEWYPQEEVLEDDRSIAYDRLPQYDALSRTRRAQSVEMFDEMTGASLEDTFGEYLVSNTAYYASPVRPEGLLPWLLNAVIGLFPVVAYGGLGWFAFRRFYRVHIERPLGELSAAAQRIAAQDLDFSIEPVRGRELGRLSKTLEAMRASLLEAQRELWRTAEERRRLNAAFAHDMRTPVTVLKGTVEMAKMRLARGTEVDERELDTIAGQAGRLERYAQAMSGVAKLEDRPVEREEMVISDLVERLRTHAVEVVAARAGELKVCLEGDCEDGAVTSQTAWVDLALVEEVLDNLLSNACGHARERIAVLVRAKKGMLDVYVTDDGDGFTPEALRRGCDPFYSENKSAEHFGLGLNISHILCGLHGGSLDLSNAEQGGARVCAHFEIGADQNPAEDGSKSDDPGLDENSKKQQGGGRGFSRFACPQKSRRG